MTERDVVTVQADGRMTITDAIRKATGIDGKKSFCQLEVYGKNKDKILITILNRWDPKTAKEEETESTSS